MTLKFAKYGLISVGVVAIALAIQGLWSSISLLCEVLIWDWTVVDLNINAAYLPPFYTLRYFSSIIDIACYSILLLCGIQFVQRKTGSVNIFIGVLVVGMFYFNLLPIFLLMPLETTPEYYIIASMLSAGIAYWWIGKLLFFIWGPLIVLYSKKGIRKSENFTDKTESISDAKRVERPYGVIIACLFLLFNILCLILIWIEPKIFTLINELPLMPLTKLWLVNTIGFLGINWIGNLYIFLNYYFSLLNSHMIFNHLNLFLSLLLNIIALVGIFRFKKWGHRLFIYLLTCMILFGTMWPVIFKNAMQTMETYMGRAYNAVIYNNYWGPLRTELYPDAKPAIKMNAIQYCPPEQSAGYCTPTKTNKNMDCQDNEKSKNSQENERDKNIFLINKVLFEEGAESFTTSEELLIFLIIPIKFLFFLFYVVIPANFIYYFTKPSIKSLYYKNQTIQSSGNDRISLPFFIFIIIFASLFLNKMYSEHYSNFYLFGYYFRKFLGL